MRIAICDDNETMLNYLYTQITNEFQASNVRFTAEKFVSGREFLAQHKNLPFDAVFLDIIMPDMDGFAVAKEIRTISDKTCIVFVTTENTLVYDSFNFQPFDFIPKHPPETLSSSGDDFVAQRIHGVVGRLLQKLSEIDEICLPLPYGDKTFVKITDVQFVKTAGNYIEYCIRNSDPIRVRGKLDEAENTLPKSIFVRLHKSYIVNMRFIKQINYSQLLAVLNDGTMVTISKAQKKSVELAYVEYLRNPR